MTCCLCGAQVMCHRQHITYTLGYSSPYNSSIQHSTNTKEFYLPLLCYYPFLCCIILYQYWKVFWHSEDRASWYIFLQLNQRDTLIAQIYFWNRTLHVSDSFPVHHQESSTVYTAIDICHTSYAGCLLASSQHNLYGIYLLLCIRY